MERFRRLGAFLAGLVWPQHQQCLACYSLTGGEILCSNCQRELHSLELESAGEQDDSTAFALSAWQHAGIARTLVLRLKHHNEAAAALELARGMVQVTQRMNLPADTVLTWAPMPDLRRRHRGIDHGSCLAHALAQELGLPVRPLLRRARRTRSQVGLSQQERRSNLIRAFSALEEITFPVLIVDDVMTTGSTANACTEALMAAGATWVKAVTATKAMPRHAPVTDKGQWKLEDHF